MSKSLAPVLPFTIHDVFQFAPVLQYPHRDSIYLNEWLQLDERWHRPELDKQWETLRQLNYEVNKLIEKQPDCVFHHLMPYHHAMHYPRQQVSIKPTTPTLYKLHDDPQRCCLDPRLVVKEILEQQRDECIVTGAEPCYIFLSGIGEVLLCGGDIAGSEKGEEDSVQGV